MECVKEESKDGEGTTIKILREFKRKIINSKNEDRDDGETNRKRRQLKKEEEVH